MGLRNTAAGPEDPPTGKRYEGRWRDLDGCPSGCRTVDYRASTTFAPTMVTKTINRGTMPTLRNRESRRRRGGSVAPASSLDTRKLTRTSTAMSPRLAALPLALGPGETA